MGPGVTLGSGRSGLAGSRRVDDLDLLDQLIAHREAFADVGGDRRAATDVRIEVVERDGVVAVDEPAKPVGGQCRLASNDGPQLVGALGDHLPVVDPADMVGERDSIRLVTGQRVEVLGCGGDGGHVAIIARGGVRSRCT